MENTLHMYENIKGPKNIIYLDHTGTNLEQELKSLNTLASSIKHAANKKSGANKVFVANQVFIG